MNRRRPLYQMLSMIATELPQATAAIPLQTGEIELTLPLDLRLPLAGGELTGDLPLFRLRTAFDPEPAQLYVVLHQVAL